MSSGIRAIGIDRYIDQQLHPQRVADPGMAARLSDLTTIGMSSREIARSSTSCRSSKRRRERKAERRRPTRPERRQNPIRSSSRPTA